MIFSSRYRRSILALLFTALMPIAARAQWENSGADAVESFTPGAGAGLGSDHYPGNVLGLPDSTARTDVPTIDPFQILSLGLGGEIILRFDRAPIVDIPGPDFTVFENAFAYTIGGKERIYAEPGEVAVSRDGVHFYPFPFDSLTLRGCAGVGPTHGQSDPGDPLLAGGNSFDLHDIGIDSIRWVRIRDVTSIVKNNPSHPFWDATLSGFDLDAVVRATRSRPELAGIAIADDRLIASLAPNPIAGRALLRFDAARSGALRVRVIDLLGRDLLSLADGAIAAGKQAVPLDLSSLPGGFYIVVVEIDGRPATTLRARVDR